MGERACFAVNVAWVILGLVLAALPGTRALADTVYLKNGSYIDGIVRSRDAETILLEIGRIGKMELRLEEIYEIEKNSRTGGELFIPVDGRVLDVTVKAGAARPAKDGKDGKETGAEGEKKLGEPKGEPAKAAESGKSTEAGKSAGAGDARKPGEMKKESGAPPKATGREDEGEALDKGAAKAASAEPGAKEPDMDPALRSRIEKLVRDLQQQQSRDRVRAERHLKAVGPPAIPFLLPIAKSDSELVRVTVFRLFHSYGDERVIESCIEALADPNEYVRDFAHRTLGRVTKEDFGYQPQASPRRREYAREKWRKWWEEEKKTLEELENEARGGAGEFRSQAGRGADAKTETAPSLKN